MSITRRRVLQLAGTGALALAVPACGVAPRIAGARSLTVWSVDYLLDDVLARWRRINSTQQVTRVPMAQSAIVARLRNALAGNEPIPDVIVASTDTLAHVSEPGVLHPLNDIDFALDALTQAGITQCQTSDARLLALPLAMNPLGLWYRSDLLHRAGLPQQPDNVAARIGTDWQQLFDFGTAFHATLPDVAWCADALSDVFLPLARTPMPLNDAAHYALRVRQSHADAGVTRNSGAWFDALQRDRVAMVVAGSWMQRTLARTTRPEEFPWRVVSPPGGCIAGASVAVAISEASNMRDTAIQFVRDIVFDRELQLALSDSAQVIPALQATYSDGRFQRMEPFCAGQTIGKIWTDDAQRMSGQPMQRGWITQRDMAAQLVRQALHGELTADWLTNELNKLSSSSERLPAYRFL